MLDIQDLPGLYTAFRSRHNERDERWDTMDRVVRGDFSVFDPDDEKIDSKSPNLVQVALEDTAEAASLMPTLRVVPSKPGARAKTEAAAMEKAGVGYWDYSKMDLLIPQTIMDMAAFGAGVWTVLPDWEIGGPVFRKRDARTFYPEPGWQPGDVTRRGLFARVVYWTQLPKAWQAKLEGHVMAHAHDMNRLSIADHNGQVVLCEYMDEDEILIAVLYQAQATGAYVSAGVEWNPVVLERIENKAKVCPIVLGSRFTLDGEFRGQFDQVIGVLEAHVRLMSMVIDYADQAVYSDVWVKDLVGQMPFGGGAYIELGPNGAIGRVPPAVSSMNVQEDIRNLVDSFHVGGRWPKTRPGEVDQSIASAKFIEAAAGMMNTAIRTYHQLLKHMMEQGLRIAYKMDKAYFPGQKTASGVLRNQEFIEDYDTSILNLKHKVKVEYGLGLGRDPAQSAVLMLQYAQNEYVSHEFVQENIDGLTDVARERIRIDLQKMREMALAKLLMGLQDGSLPESALIEIAREREKGGDLFQLYEKFIVKPKEQNLEAGLQSGLGGGIMPPGPPGQAPLPGPGGEPGMAPAPPMPPDAMQMIGRLSVPMAGGGGFMGTQYQQGGQ